MLPQMSPQAANLAVKNPERYGYDAEGVLLHMVRLCLNLTAAQPRAFTRALAADPDFSAAYMEAAVQRLASSERNTEAWHCAPRFEDVLRQVDAVCMRSFSSFAQKDCRMPADRDVCGSLCVITLLTDTLEFDLLVL